MNSLTVLRKSDKTILKDGRKIYATITYNTNTDYKFILWLRGGVALSGFESDTDAIKRAIRMHSDWQETISNINK